MKRYPIPAEETRVEIKVKNSRFIATAAPVFSVDEARAFVARVKAEFADASHNVPAYQVGFGAAVTAHCSDDGEPAGTAGRPALAVVQGSGLGDIAVVVTRYFGGTKLGTGGLVRAYGDAVKAVLDVLPRAEKVPTYTVLMTIPYSYVERLRLLVAEHNGRLLEEAFAANVDVLAQFTTERFPAFQAALIELSHGSLTAEIVETNEETIMPIGSFEAS
ncbi:MAG: YigZ family protein [Anaerolineales bacterium]|nr:YigZ family protein [Anaerolineales bacterium]